MKNITSEKAKEIMKSLCNKMIEEFGCCGECPICPIRYKNDESVKVFASAIQISK